ncbi:condensation domain-containing protein [Phytoactinopolyspora halotolerans]|uniref:Condensation domain-containing protein n=1 Tax=Phytoactinopolyspora halotolerans TaxID=1981512 RepID=A0A6L9S414_9ACTN|nr:condensation domain-containing protein [Phytoactinopolyspora halotolerans]NED99855.1 hypothetical protein [Phytoactinopolyspora halotolerans]
MNGDSGSAALAPLCYGQLSHFRHWSTRVRPELAQASNLTAVWRLPDDTAAPAVRVALETIAYRHEALRTRFQQTPGRDGFVQVVEGRPRIVLPILRVGDDGWAPRRGGLYAPRAHVEHFVPREILDFFDRPFSLTADPGWRAAIVDVGGVPRHLCFICPHVISDMFGLACLGRELYALLSGTDAVALPAPRLQPRQVARRERAESATARGVRRHAYWRRTLAEMSTLAPRIGDGGRREGDQAKASRGILRTNMRMRAVERLAARYSATAPSLVLALAAIELARWHPDGTLPVGLTSSNRFLPGMRDLVGNVVQQALAVIPVPDDTEIRRFLCDVHRRALTAYRHSAVDPIAVDEDKEAMRARSRIPLDPPYYFNSLTEQKEFGVVTPAERTRPSTEFVRLSPMELGTDPGMLKWRWTLGLTLVSDGYLCVWTAAGSSYRDAALVDGICESVLGVIRHGLSLLAHPGYGSLSVNEFRARAEQAADEQRRAIS